MANSDQQESPSVEFPGCSLARTFGVIPSEIDTINRRRRTTQYSALLAGVVATGYAVFDYFMGNFAGMGINGPAALFYFLCASHLQRPCGIGVRHFLVGAGWLHLMCLTVLVLGPDPGAHLFLMGGGVISALLFRDAHPGWKWFYMGLSVFGLTVIELGFLPEPIVDLKVGDEIPFIRLSCILLTMTFIFLVVRRYLTVLDEARAALREEHERSEELLLNILPGSIANRLKRGESVADAFDDVTVLFADIAAFTPMAAGTPPEKLVQILNDIFSAFDGMAERHGLEKIKTIGDAYMVAGGIPDRVDNHTAAVASMAVEMLAWVEGYRERMGFNLGLRIGMHTGPVVAGVIGSKKFIYDLWGDTVNLASRMESQGSAGHIQVTGDVQERLASSFHFEKRGTLEVKGRGEMVTYWLEARKGPNVELAAG